MGRTVNPLRGLANNTTTVGDNNDNVGRRERVGVIVYAGDTKGWFAATLAVDHESGRM